MSRLLKVIIAINLVTLAVLVFAYPHLMVGPGELIDGHQSLEKDCFACHTSFRGASANKCQSCHEPANIGKLSSTGTPLAKQNGRTPFHQELISQDCMSCHSDHSGVTRYHPEGSFDHALLNSDTVNKCEACHKSPTDSLHKQITGNCAQCHTTARWTPASFDHDKYFVLDSDHKAPCTTCHVRNNYNAYTCYGCHEHTPANIQREHIEEGIRNFDNCVDCHRSADEDDIRSGGDNKRLKESD
ncbi:MAG: hypothetical protein RJA34_2984 [Pseudomonadota bacterium]|jgi:hypothetical protein